MLKNLFSRSLEEHQVIVDKAELTNLKGQLDAISRSQAVIEFDLKGNILFANDNFLSVVGYSLEEVQGKHHGIFVDQKYRASQAYKDFWREIGEGKFQSGEYCRFTKSGEVIWIEASYNPIFDSDGHPFKVVKYATDITAKKT